MGNQSSVFLEAASTGNSTALDQILHKSGSALVSTCDEDGWTGLHYAASQGHQANVCLLLNHGADVNKHNKNGETALHLAATCGATGVVRDLLLKHAAIDASDWEGMTALHKAAVRGHTPVVAELLWQKADTNARLMAEDPLTLQNGLTALHLAAWKGHLVTVDLLLHTDFSDQHVDLEALNDDGRSALHLAAGQGHLTVVQQLLQANATIFAADITGATAANLAEMSGHTEVAALLHNRQYRNGQHTADHLKKPSAPPLTADLSQQLANRPDGAAASAMVEPAAAASSSSIGGWASEAILHRLQGWVPHVLLDRRISAANGSVQDEAQAAQQQPQARQSGGYGLLDSDSEDEHLDEPAQPAEPVQEVTALERQLAGIQLQGSSTSPSVMAQPLAVQSWTHYSMSELDPVALVNDPSGCGLVPVGHISRQMFQHTLQQQSVMVDRLLRPQAVHALKPRLVAASALQHPYIAPVIGGSLEFGGAVVYGVAQCCTLDDMLSGRHAVRLLFHERVAVAAKCCEALIYLHSKGLKHGSLDTTCVVLQHGMPQVICDLNTLDNIGDLKMLPCNDEWVTCTQDDTLSLGVLMLQLLTARHSRGLIEHVKLKLNSGEVDVDSRAEQSPYTNAFAKFALRCTADRPFSLEQYFLPGLNRLAAKAASAYSARLSQHTPVGFSNQHVPDFRTSAGPDKASNGSSSCTQTVTTQPPELYTCPISQDVMQDPVVAADGWTYDRKAIQEWFDRGHQSSPMTNTRLSSTNLVPNRRIKSAIEEWKQQHRTL